MGRPEKLSKEDQADAINRASVHGRKETALVYGISEFTLRRYEKIAKLNAEAKAGQRAEEIRTAEEIAAESTPEAA